MLIYCFCIGVSRGLVLDRSTRRHASRSWSCWDPILGGEDEVVGISDAMAS